MVRATQLPPIKEAKNVKNSGWSVKISNERSQSAVNPKVVSCVADPTKTRGMLAYQPRYKAKIPPSFHKDLNAYQVPE